MAFSLLLFLAVRFDVDLAYTRERIGDTNPVLYLSGFLIYYTTFLFRGARWRILLSNAGVNKDVPLPSLMASARLVLLGWWISAITWFRIGDAFRAYAYCAESGASLPRTGGTVLAERVLDVATISGLLIVAFILLFVNAEHRPSMTFLVAGACLLVGVLILLVVLHFLRERVVMYLPKRAQIAYQGFREGTFDSFRQLPTVSLMGLFGWLAEVGRLYLVVQSAGLDVGFGLIVFVTIANALLSAIPITPGGLGVVEPGIAGLLALSMASEDAFAVAILDRSISYLSIIIFGCVAFLVHQRARTAHGRVSAYLAQADERQAGTPPI